MHASLISARADTDPSGLLRLWWVLGGPPCAVDIAVGSTPDHIDHQHVVTVPAGQTTWSLDRPASARVFVSVAPHGGGPAVVTCDRRIAFRGITNFRDLGGYRCRSGIVRWGRLFRADALHGLLNEDRDMYRQLGVRQVFDLRNDEERSERPNPMESVSLTVLSRPFDAPARAETPSSDGERILADMYRGLLDHAGTKIGLLFRGLVSEGGLPAVFHCHAGKDRTGVVAALLLEALGVARADILDDYELTGRYRLRSQQDTTYERLLQSGLAPEAAAAVLTSPRWAMASALEYLDEHYGGIDAYLTDPADLEKEQLQALRELLIDTAAATRV